MRPLGIQGYEATFGTALALVVVWTIAWKGWALWRAARREDKVWFVVLLLVNTLGLLEIFYLFVIGKDKQEPPVQGIGKNRKERGSLTSASSS
ncbi:MAG TPA: DUF5652 family protein [Candidatus Eisenbacteria bacterium]|nr:DUF5652 family protein [Candidatus Eisenbacteria bacterium]